MGYFAAAVLVLILSLLHPGDAGAAPKLIIGYAAMSARVVPLWIAEEQGILAKYGVDSEQVFIRGAPTLVTGLTSGDIHFGSTGGTATLAAIAGGHDLKMVAAFSSRNTYDLVTRPSIKRAEELRGKRFGVTSIGGTVWMGIMLWLEHFGLDEQRDKIHLQVIGDQSIQMQALENGTIDAAVLDGVFSRRLKQKGFNITGEYSELKHLFTSQAIVVQVFATTCRYGGESVESSSGSDRFFAGAEKQTNRDQDVYAPAESRRCRCGRRLCRSPSRHGPHTLSVARRTA